MIRTSTLPPRFSMLADFFVAAPQEKAIKERKQKKDREIRDKKRRDIERENNRIDLTCPVCFEEFEEHNLLTIACQQRRSSHKICALCTLTMAEEIKTHPSRGVRIASDRPNFVILCPRCPICRAPYRYVYNSRQYFGVQCLESIVPPAPMPPSPEYSPPPSP
jgi:uncharacterized Fe-S radical SAM superfamily protein PflX